jgi:hypothetical protein
MGKSLSNLSQEATEETNTTGETTPILTVEPDDGTMLRLLNRVPTGSGSGIPVFAVLKDGSDNYLPVDTTLIFRVLRPTDDTPVAVSVAEPHIAPWNSLSTAEQRNSENIDSVKIQLQGDRINIRDSDVLRVEVESSAQIDWSNSELYFAREGVEESAMGV